MLDDRRASRHSSTTLDSLGVITVHYSFTFLVPKARLRFILFLSTAIVTVSCPTQFCSLLTVRFLLSESMLFLHLLLLFVLFGSSAAAGGSSATGEKQSSSATGKKQGSAGKKQHHRGDSSSSQPPKTESKIKRGVIYMLPLTNIVSTALWFGGSLTSVRTGCQMFTLRQNHSSIHPCRQSTTGIHQ